MPLDSAQLAALVAIMQHGSFERAARALHVTPSAVSQRIARLEDRLGLVLIARGSPCAGTPAGERLARHAEAVALAERETLNALGVVADDAALPLVRVAVNADSLVWCVASNGPVRASDKRQNKAPCAGAGGANAKQGNAGLARVGRSLWASPWPAICGVAPLGRGARHARRDAPCI